MRVCYLGTGSWGFCLATLLAKKGIRVTSWTTSPELAASLNATRIHPRFPEHPAPENITFTTDIAKALDKADLIVESVTTAGIRPVFEQAQKSGLPDVPICITSKGIELKTGLLTPDILTAVLGEGAKSRIGMLSGPSFAQEIIRGLPTSVVGTSFSPETTETICEAFTTETLRVYPNSDVYGVALVGALKNAIAIACGMSDGMQMGNSAKAALMTRGLHEIRKLGVAMGCRPETFSGLAGMGDLTMTASSPLSRNYRFGQLLAQGLSSDEARDQIGMVVEGSYSCEAALRLSREYGIAIPITEGVFHIIQGDIKLRDALRLLMKRSVKEEHL
ncbi:MAG: NAD(P)-dependent glycerol-3-phosphate dehydrogenase [Chlamydiia bacterium]|nr:NAD(P)-dependent glycerol-3-phosphate dehydrogenase [Chlamydiia bacterium]